MLNGLLCGLVEDNLDPLKIGRLKIRVPALHGTNPGSSSYIPTKDLIWSYPSIPFYAGYDCGSFIVPPVGTYVWTMPVEGENSYLVYFGGVFGTGPVNPKFMNTLDPENSAGVSMGQYFTPAGEVETPTDLRGLEYGQAGVIFKSQKGHTILYSDQDDNEFFEIIDRSGQKIKMNCPVSSNENKANAARRGTNKTHDGGSIEIQSGNATIKIENGKITISGDSISLISSQSSIEF